MRELFTMVGKEGAHCCKVKFEREREVCCFDLPKGGFELVRRSENRKLGWSAASYVLPKLDYNFLNA